jgi:hypothetical protein
MQTFIETGDCKLNDIQVRFVELPNIFNKFETAQSELELSDDTDHSVDRQQFEDQHFEVKAKFNELLHPVVDPPRSRHSAPCSSLSGHSSTSPRSHASSSHIKLPYPHLKVIHVVGYTSETHLKHWLLITQPCLVFRNSTISLLHWKVKPRIW